MKKLLLLLFVFASVCINAQNSTCAGANPFCAGGATGVNFPATTGAGAAQNGPFYDCLNTVPNPAWYYLQISQSGTLNILIQGQQGVGTNTVAGQDVDFICWGPFTNISAGVCGSLTAANVVDCSYSGSYTETLTIPNGVSGQYYMVLITNFANVSQNIVFDQLNTAGNGFGNTDCNILQATNSSICMGSVANITATNNSNLTTPTYSLNPGGITSTNGNFTVSPNSTTTYTVYVSGINSSNAVITQTTVATVSVFPKPVVAPTTTQSTCTNTLSGFDLHLTFNSPTPSPSYTVAWTPIPNGLASATQSSLTGAIGAGTYVAVVTATGGCTANATIIINPQPAPANYTLTPLGSTFSITCAQPQLILTATQPSYSYTWTNGTSAPSNDPDILINNTNLGTYTITGVNPTSGCSATHIFTVGQNFAAPSSSITPTFQNITCLTGAQTVSATASPTANITHLFSSPSGATVAVNSYTAIYIPGGPGTYTHCLINNINGCSTCKEFTVASNDNFPTLNVSSTNNYTLGCSTLSVGSVDLNGNTVPVPNGSISYTVLPPPTGATSYTLGGATHYTMNIPGEWTAVVRDNSNQCQTKVVFSVISNTMGPDIGADVPNSILTCNTPSTTLTATSETPNSLFAWIYPGPTGTVTTINAYLPVMTTTNVTNTLVANYTLSVQHATNLCYSSLVVPIKQNLFPPRAIISAGQPSFELTCNTPSVTMTNGSATGITPASGYPTNSVIAVQLWEGPTPQQPSQLSPNYTGFVPGIYTLTVKDYNNGCTSFTTVPVVDNRIYPVVNNPAPPASTLDCGITSMTIAPVITGSATNLSYNWVPPSNVITGAVTAKNLVVYSPGNYRVLVTNTINGCASSGAVDVVTGVLDASFAPDYTSGFAPLTVTFANNSHSSGGSTSSITTVWSFGNGTAQTTTATSIPAIAVYTQPGTYTITQYASKGVCQDTAIRYVHVDIPSKLEIPNVFTPNGDGVNDLLFLKVSNLDEISASIFDRWGHKVYELTSTTGNIAWDGKNEYGKEAVAGVYFYIIKATGKDGQTYDNKGTVTLYR